MGVYTGPPYPIEQDSFTAKNTPFPQLQTRDISIHAGLEMQLLDMEG